MKLSILDQAPISAGKTAQEALYASIELAKCADKLSYTRYWIAEHHDMSGLACPTPDVMLGIIGSKTERIRIGAGAVLLPHYKPFKVAETYNLLGTLFPDRVDLGIGRAPGGSAEASIALSDNFLKEVKKMPESIDNLLGFLYDIFPKDHIFSKVSPTPIPTSPPVPWLLGTSEKSAILAAEKGMAYAFGHFMSDADGPAIVKKYKESFTVKNEKSNPQTIIAITVICAETTAKAEELALSSMLWSVQQAKGDGKNGVPSIEEAKSYSYTKDEMEAIQKMRKTMVIGNPDEVYEQIQVLQALYEADEFMIVTITYEYKARLRSYELIDEIFIKEGVLK